MTDIFYIDRLTKKKEQEKVYGQFFIELLYGKSLLSSLVALFILPVVARIPFLSALYGSLQKTRLSRRKIKPFIAAFRVDALEFAEPVEAFRSFNDFFIRKLKKGVRPLVQEEDVVIMPADARYLVFPHVAAADDFWVKGKKFSLATFLQDSQLAERFTGGAMAIARLCPTDYHRFHFPCDGIAGTPRLIQGPLYSVNPLALASNLPILTHNKRVITVLETIRFGSILFIEIGATYVGTIHQTFTPDTPCAKGEEKGYFSFGGSCLVLLFEPDQIVFDSDLIHASSEKIEVRGLLGQSLARKV